MKFYLETYGCQANKSDSGIIAGILEKNNHVQTTSISKASIIILNTCYVKQSTQNRIINRIKALKPVCKKKLVIIAGCMPEIEKDRIKHLLPTSILLSPRQVHNILKAIKTKKDCLGKPKINKCLLPKSPISFSSLSTSPAPSPHSHPSTPQEHFNTNPSQEHPHTTPAITKIKQPATHFITPTTFPTPHQKTYTLQISEGCTNHCSYCAAKLARGDIHSFPQKDIEKEFRQALKKGYKNFCITAQDTASYGLDNHPISRLPSLLHHLTNIKGNFQIRVGMMNPSSVLPILTPLQQAFKNKKIFPFLHIPLQSGSNRILKDMNRKYTIKEFRRIVSEFRKTIPDLNFATDIIVGYPTEKESDFQSTIKIIKQLKPEVLNISRFSSRPKTPASSLPQFSTQELKRRSKLLTELQKNLKKQRLTYT
jgi:MiaB-like tRNA modifying enzyme